MVYKLLVSKEVLLQNVAEFFGENSEKSLRKWMKEIGEDKLKSPQAEEIIKNIHRGIIGDMSIEQFGGQIVNMFKKIGGDSFKSECVASAIDMAEILNEEDIEQKFTLGSSKTEIKGLPEKKRRLSNEDLKKF